MSNEIKGKHLMVCTPVHSDVSIHFMKACLDLQKEAILNKTKIGRGVVVMPRAYLSNYSEIGDYSILNSSSNVEHECKIGKGVHIMSGACIGGRSIVGDFATIGTNAILRFSKH